MRSKAAALAIFLALPALAQNAPSAQSVPSACGAADTNFKVTAVPANGYPVPVAGKAQVFLLEVQDRVAFCPGGCGITTKIGLDGSWVGAMSGNSALPLSVDPGEHHLCAAWQSRLSRLRKHVQLAGFTAEPGKMYYFRVHITPGTPNSVESFAFEAINPDEGRLLLASSPRSTWVVK